MGLFQRIMPTTSPFCSQEDKVAVAVAIVVCGGGGDDVLDAARVLSHHVGGENEDSLVFSARPLRVIQQIGVILAEVPQIIPCHEHKHNRGWARG